MRDSESLEKHRELLKSSDLEERLKFYMSYRTDIKEVLERGGGRIGKVSLGLRESIFKKLGMEEYVKGVYEVPKLNNIEKIKSYTYEGGIVGDRRFLELRDLMYESGCELVSDELDKGYRDIDVRRYVYRLEEDGLVSYFQIKLDETSKVYITKEKLSWKLSEVKAVEKVVIEYVNI